LFGSAVTITPVLKNFHCADIESIENWKPEGNEVFY